MKDLLDYIIIFFDKLTGGINQLSQGDLQAIAQERWYQMILFWGTILFWITILVAGVMGVWWFWLRYDKKVLVKKLKGKAVIDTYMDKARQHKDARDKEKLTLLKTKKTMPIPSHNYTQKMGKKDFYEVYLCDDGSLRPKYDTDIEEIEKAVEVSDEISGQEVAGWRLEEMKLAEERYKKQTFFDKYKDQLMTFLAMVIAVAIIWITVSKIQTGQIANAKALSDVAKAITELRGACI